MKEQNDSQSPEQANSEIQLYTNIPLSRLIWVSLVSQGLYEFYWIYKNWRHLKERYGLNIAPFWRGIFGIFYCYSIFKAISDDQKTNAILKARFSANTLSSIWIAIFLIGFLLDLPQHLGLNVLGVLIGLPSFLCFVPVQLYLNRVNASLTPSPPYTPWSSGHTVCVVAGLIFWLMFALALTAELGNREPSNEEPTSAPSFANYSPPAGSKS